MTRRREIEDAASALFRRQGYSGTSVRDIARALDIQGASLYAHVSSKQDVLWSIVEQMATRFETAADLATETCGPDPRSQLEALVRTHVEIVTADVERASVFVHEWRALSPERRREIGRRRDAYERRFRDAIAAGGADGTFVAVDPVVAAAYILTAINGIVTWYRPDGRLAPPKLICTYTDLALWSVLTARDDGPAATPSEPRS